MKYTFNGQGLITLPGSKSIAIRALIVATFLNKPLKIYNFPSCEDSITLLEALQILGFKSQVEKDFLNLSPPTTVTLNPDIYIKDSAAALRFLLLRLAGWQDMNARIKLSPQLNERPVEPFLDLIPALGGDAFKSGTMIYVKGKVFLSLTKEAEEILAQNASISSQFLSAILLSTPLFEKGIRIKQTKEQVSSSYISLTLKVLESFGIKIYREEGYVVINQQDYLNPETYTIEEDFSSACYFWALGALSSNPIGIVTEKTTSQQADFQFLELLRNMGAAVNITGKTITVKSRALHGTEADMGDMPDQVPTLAVLALFADSKTKITNIHHLRYKESDRISALVTELLKIGIDIHFEGETLTINPLLSDPPPVTLNTYNDHRLVMSFTILTSIFQQIQIDSRESVRKSFPDFFDKLAMITV
ncbi:MAG: 3-phosphoshikimate 1-carboxyvinyltransferase [Candidatus Cloacimonetes bacterium]|nr:3-phosphoshikimate 1-carboxyvinyltransferase [Candidatus Cloacimonadota bacterium]